MSQDQELQTWASLFGDAGGTNSLNSNMFDPSAAPNTLRLEVADVTQEEVEAAAQRLKDTFNLVSRFLFFMYIRYDCGRLRRC